MARKVTDPSFRLIYPEDYYTVQGAETVLRTGTKDDISAMRAEYTRMRDAAQKRIKRLEKTYPDTKAAQHKYDTGKKDSKGRPIYASGFQKLKNIDPRDLPNAMAELKKFMTAKGSTVTGQKQIKEKTIATWQKQGLNLTPKNYDTAIKILEEMRKRKIVYGSDKVVQLADTMMDMDERRTNDWLNHLATALENVDQISAIPEASGYSFDEVISMLGD